MPISSHPLLLLLLSACAGDGDSAATDLPSPCEEETRGLDAAPGLSVAGEGLDLRLTALSPVPPSAAATNAWTVALTPAPADAPSVTLFMPDHGHGAPDGAATLLEDGAAALSLDFTMPGLWEVTVETADGAVVLPVCAEP